MSEITKFEVGKTYRLRGGGSATVIRTDVPGCKPIEAIHNRPGETGDGDECLHSPSGCYWLGIKGGGDLILPAIGEEATHE